MHACREWAILQRVGYPAKSGLSCREWAILQRVGYPAESGLSKDLWAEAAATQMYTRNLLPSVRHPVKIPKESWTGCRQRVDHLRPWGCITWAKVPEELIKSKLDPWSVKTCLVGYANGKYQLFDQGLQTIVTSWDVIFKEGSGHRSLTVLDNND